MHTPNSPPGFACPGSPEDQDMQLQIQRPNWNTSTHHDDIERPGEWLGNLARFACPGSQENQDMQTPVASWGYACPDLVPHKHYACPGLQEDQDMQRVLKFQILTKSASINALDGLVLPKTRTCNQFCPTPICRIKLFQRCLDLTSANAHILSVRPHSPSSHLNHVHAYHHHHHHSHKKNQRLLASLQLTSASAALSPL